MWDEIDAGSDPERATPPPRREALLAAASGLAEHPSDAYARDRHLRVSPVAWGALAASALVNAGLVLVLAGSSPEAAPPPPRTVRLVFAPAPMPPAPPPPLKGSGARRLVKPDAPRFRPTLVPSRAPDAVRPVRPRPAVPRDPVPEPPAETAALTEGDPAGVADGVPGGVEGGIVGGVLGGVLGGVPGGIADGAERPVLVELAELTLRRRVAPDYPALARKAGIAGLVVLEIVVDATGSVADVRVVRSVPLLDGAAVAAVRQWEFEPITLRTAGPAARKARAFVEVQFDLA